jgi:hypothetical protein
LELLSQGSSSSSSSNSSSSSSSSSSNSSSIRNPHNDSPSSHSDSSSSSAIISREGYERAVSNSPDFVERQLLCFLRAEEFNVQRAAARCLKFYQAKLALFGPELVGKDLGLKDLSELERQALYEGAVQLLPKRDRTGRAILTLFARVGREYPVEVMVRVEEGQRKHSISLGIPHNSFFFNYSRQNLYFGQE